MEMPTDNDAKVPLTARQISNHQREQAAADALEHLHLANGVSLDQVPLCFSPTPRCKPILLQT